MGSITSRTLKKLKARREAAHYFALAINASIDANNKEKIDSITALKSRLIPKDKIEQTVSNIYKIDIFYDERNIPQSEETADFIIKKLQKK